MLLFILVILDSELTWWYWSLWFIFCPQLHKSIKCKFCDSVPALHSFLLVWSRSAASSLHNSVQCLWMERLCVGLLRRFLVWWLWLLCVCGWPLRSFHSSLLCGLGCTGQCGLFLCSKRDCLFAECISLFILLTFYCCYCIKYY